MKPDDRQARHAEVQMARDAKALLENPLLDEWKREELDKVMAMLANADPGLGGDGERQAAQQRLLALNDLGASLSEKIDTGMMAERQISEDKAKRERRTARLEVANG